MVGFNSVQNNGKWLNFSVSIKTTLLFATRGFLILFYLDSQVLRSLAAAPVSPRKKSLCLPCTIKTRRTAQFSWEQSIIARLPAVSSKPV